MHSVLNWNLRNCVGFVPVVTRQNQTFKMLKFVAVR